MYLPLPTNRRPPIARVIGSNTKDGCGRSRLEALEPVGRYCVREHFRIDDIFECGIIQARHEALGDTHLGEAFSQVYEVLT